MTDRLTDKSYWERNFDIDHQGQLFYFNTHNNHSQYIDDFFAFDQSKTCIEVGAYPGRMLGYFAKKFGFKPTAIDFLDDKGFMEANFSHNDIDCEVIIQDFEKWKTDRQFDVVMSYGFVEHFVNYEEIIARHVKLVKPGGHLIISVPSLKYLQGWLRKFLYNEAHFRTIIESHNTSIMDEKTLASIIKSRGLEIAYSSYIRGFTFWPERNEKIINKNRMWCYDLVATVSVYLNKLKVSSQYFSPEIIVIAKKPGDV
ncbi:MAG: methyltransferase domain-containing protein [Cytophagales bacterium]